MKHDLELNASKGDQFIWNQLTLTVAHVQIVQMRNQTLHMARH